MEILATNVSYAPAIFITIVFLAICTVPFFVMFDKSQGTGSRLFGGAVTCAGIVVLIAVWIDPAYVTYDAIITDWNAVYEQGYEVVESNGKIVTLQKVSE